MFYEPKNGHGLKHNPFKCLVAPRPIGWISTLDPQGRVNLSPYSFFNAVASDPPVVIFSAGGSHVDGGIKDSVANVEATAGTAARPQYSKEDMLRTRVARYKELRPFPRAFVDTVIPEYARDIMSVIGESVMEDPEMQPAISDEHCFSVGLLRLEPGQGAGLLSHTTEEVFIPLNGKFTIIWGDDGENEIELDQWDTCSVPIGIMRGFRNSDTKTVVALAIVGGHDGGRVEWHAELIARAREHGGQLDETGYLTPDSET